MKTIWKYTLQPISTFEMPIGAKPLSVGVQFEEVMCMWVMVDPTGPLVTYEERTFVVFGTGHPIPDNLDLNFIGTVMSDGLVFHVFEKL